jgi:hypothetical protein
MVMGKLFSPDISDVIAVISKKKGVITNVAKHYEVHPETIYDYCYRNPEAFKALESVRAYKKHDFIDLAEHVTFYNMTRYEDNPGLAQRAADKVLDKLGHLRGWKEDESGNKDSSPKQNEIDLKHENMLQADKIFKLEALLANKS